MIQIPLFNLSTILWASCPKQRVFSKTGPCRVSVGKGEYGKNTWRKALWNAGKQQQQIWSSNAGSSIYVCACSCVCMYGYVAPPSIGVSSKILEWVAMSSSRGSSQPRDGTQISLIAGRFFTSWATWEAQESWRWVVYPFSRGSSWPRNQTRVSCIAGGFFTSWAPREAHVSPD